MLQTGAPPRADGLWLLDAYGFAYADEIRRGALPHTWDVTSDAIAARYAVFASAKRLVLLKSVTVPEGMSWDEAGRRNLVDPHFAQVLRGAPRLPVRVVNLRAETAT
jgi:hypothetical protein